MSKGSKSGAGGSKGGVRGQPGGLAPGARGQTNRSRPARGPVTGQKGYSGGLVQGSAGGIAGPGREDSANSAPSGAQPNPSTPRFSGSELLQAADNVSRETLNRLQIYSSLLLQWQKTINLVAPSTVDQIWERHFADSAQLLERAPASARCWVDLGSGAGFPGLVIAILLAGRVEAGIADAGSYPAEAPGVGRAAGHGPGSGEARQLGHTLSADNVSRETFEAETLEFRAELTSNSALTAGPGAKPEAVGFRRTDDSRAADTSGPAQPELQIVSCEAMDFGSPAPYRVILIESDSRKCAFLAEVVRRTGISRVITVEILNRRIEKPETRASVGDVDVISARALAPLERLLAWSAPLMSAHTTALFLKGRDAEAEIEEARRKWTFACRSWPSRTDPSGKILEIQNVRPMPKDELP